MNPGLASQENQEDDGDGGRQSSVCNAEYAEEEHCECGDLSGRPGIVTIGAAVTGDDEVTDNGDAGYDSPGPDKRGERPNCCQQRKGSRP